MSVSAIIIDVDILDIEIPQELVCLPVSFQRIFNDYWEPIIDRLKLPTLHYIGVLDVNYGMWPKVKSELVILKEYIKNHPDIINV